MRQLYMAQCNFRFTLQKFIDIYKTIGIGNILKQGEMTNLFRFS